MDLDSHIWLNLFQKKITLGLAWFWNQFNSQTYQAKITIVLYIDFISSQRLLVPVLASTGAVQTGKNKVFSLYG